MAAGLELLCATTDQLISTIKVEYTKVEVAPLYESPAEVLLGEDSFNPLPPPPFPHLSICAGGCHCLVFLIQDAMVARLRKQYN